MANDLVATLPLGIVAVMGCLVLLLDVFGKEKDRRYLGYLSAGGMVLGLVVTYLLYGREWSGFITPTFGTMMAMGRYELLACAVVLLVGAVVCLLSVDHAEEQGFATGELYALVNFSVFGMMVLVTATNLVTLFVGLEVMSIAVYVLAAIKRKSAFSVEAGLKYFILGSFSSGLLLFGLAYLYGETASFGYTEIAQALATHTSGGYLDLALVMLIAAFGFKVAAVPFHMWTPDVYEGAPTPVTALMAAGVKTAAVIAMARLFATALPPHALSFSGVDVFVVLFILSAVTMTFGNLVAIQQRSMKRMLAFSSIAHAGYLLIGVMAVHQASAASAGMAGTGMGGILFYLFVYSLANLAAFAVIAHLSRGQQDDVIIDHISGLAKKSPVAALVLAVAMFSLTGVPPLAGFFGKFALFRDALLVDQERFLPLVIIAVLNSALSAYYYLRVVVYSYMREPFLDFRPVKGLAMALAFTVAGLGTVQAGIFPGRYLKAAGEATVELRAALTKTAAGAEAPAAGALAGHAPVRQTLLGPRVAETPGVPDVPGAPGVAGALGAPGVPGVAGAPGAPVEPGAVGRR